MSVTPDLSPVRTDRFKPTPVTFWGDENLELDGGGIHAA